MYILLAIVLFSAGIILTVKGGDWFIDAAVWLSDVTGISKAVIGATLVSFATTSPEFFVSTLAVTKGFTDLSVGNAVGSLICNMGVAFALLAIFMPGEVKDRFFGVKGMIMIFSAVLLWIFSLDGSVTMAEGIFLVALYGSFTLLNIKCSKNKYKTEKRKPDKKETVLNMGKFIVGAGAIVYGSNLIVDNCQIIALAIGISEAVTGLTIVAIGTSLPEIVTSISAVIKKESALSIGNIIGANTLDATLILGIGSFIAKDGLAVSSSSVTLDMPVMILLMILGVIPTLITKKIYRWQGVAILSIYAVYILILFI